MAKFRQVLVLAAAVGLAVPGNVLIRPRQHKGPTDRPWENEPEKLQLARIERAKAKRDKKAKKGNLNS